MIQQKSCDKKPAQPSAPTISSSKWKGLFSWLILNMGVRV